MGPILYTCIIVEDLRVCTEYLFASQYTIVKRRICTFCDTFNEACKERWPSEKPGRIIVRESVER